MVSLSLSQTVMVLIPVVVGAVLAIVATIAGSVFLFKLQMRREHQRLLRVQLAELVSKAYEVEHWLRRLRAARLMNGPPLEDPSPMSTVKMIARLYTPEVRAEVKKLDRAVEDFEAWVQEGELEKRNTRNISEATLGKYPTAQRAVLDAVTELANKAEVLANK